MSAPKNIVDVGWFSEGTVPGERGSAVIAGHFDAEIGKTGVFNNLNRLKPDDKILVINSFGATTTFIVQKTGVYIPGYVADVFVSNDDGTHLNLITCDGSWDEAKQSFTKRLVIFADIEI